MRNRKRGWRVALVLMVCVPMVMASAASNTAKADLFAYDGFDYTAGDPVDGLAGGTGWSTEWDKGSKTHANVVAPGLTYPGLAVSGNSFREIHINNDPGVGACCGENKRTIDTSGGSLAAAAGVVDGAGNIGADGTTVWFSWFQQRTYAFAAQPPGDARTGFGQIQIREGGTNRIQIDTLQAGDPATFLVGKIDFVAGNDDYRVWRNPDLSLGEAGLGAPDIENLAGGDLSFDNMQIRQGTFADGISTTNVDEIRYGTTFDDVRGSVIPEPGSLALLLILVVSMAGCARLRIRRRAWKV